LEKNHRWRRNSPEQRFLITDRSQAFCVVDNQLRYYSDVSQASSQVNLNGPYDLLMNSIDSVGRTFQIGANNSACEHCVTIQLLFSSHDIEVTKKIKVALNYAP
jgi:hypothetical protein